LPGYWRGRRTFAGRTRANRIRSYRTRKGRAEVYRDCQHRDRSLGRCGRRSQRLVEGSPSGAFSRQSAGWSQANRGPASSAVSCPRRPVNDALSLFKPTSFSPDCRFVVLFSERRAKMVEIGCPARGRCRRDWTLSPARPFCSDQQPKRERILEHCPSGHDQLKSVNLNSAPTGCWPSPSGLAATFLPAERYDRNKYSTKRLNGIPLRGRFNKRTRGLKPTMNIQRLTEREPF
jgi:hypothetical protein